MSVTRPEAGNAEVESILDEAFSLCRIPFVHDFMFTTDPVADISILTSPIQMQHAITARISMTGTENSSKFGHAFDYCNDFFFYTVPAFSIECMTVGFSMQQPIKGGYNEDASRLDCIQTCVMQGPLNGNGVQCSRYVRDDENGMFVILAENNNTGLTELECMKQQTTRKRKRICARFRTERLRRNLQTNRGILHAQEMSRSLSLLSVAYERRSCPLCYAIDGGECKDCTLPFRRPAHSLDFRNERRNMSLHTGLYEGGSTMRLFNMDQLPYILTELSTTSVIKGSLNHEFISKMNQFAVMDRMKFVRLNPFEKFDGGFLAFGGLNGCEGDIDIAKVVPEIFGQRDERDMVGNKEKDKGIDMTTEKKVIEKKKSDKEVKAELRRIRNREAAAKSNVKRKERNEALRKELAAAHKRAAELRSLEKNLREENVRLRSLAAKQRVSVCSHLTHIQIA